MAKEKTPVSAEHPKSPWKSKTFWSGILVSTLGFLSFMQAVPFIANSQALSSLLLVAVGLLMVILRQITRDPVSPVFNIPHPGGRKITPLPPYPQPQPPLPAPLPPIDEGGDSWNGWRDSPASRAN